MKQKELIQLIENTVRKVLKETGEMSQKDLNPGGEFYEWAQSIKKSMQQLSRLTKGKVKFIEIKPYDKYLGPYASIAIDNKRDSVWSVGDTGNAFVIENLGIAGTVQLLASALLGNDKNYEQALKNAKQMSENKKVKKNLTEANSGNAYKLAEEFEKSNDYHIFRKHYTGTIREDIKNHDGNFAMSNQLTLNIFIDVVEYIKRLGYDIIKK